MIIAEFGLHYITHLGNLESIRRRGILSLNEVLRRGIERSDISDTEVQVLRERSEPIWNRSIHDYVPLYLNPKNPMLYVRREMSNQLVILKINESVTNGGKTIFCDGNAASAATKFALDECVLAESREALRAEYWNGVEDGKRRRMAEVLIHQRVAPSEIRAVLCPNQIVATEVKNRHGLYALSSPSRFF